MSDTEEPLPHCDQHQKFEAHCLDCGVVMKAWLNAGPQPPAAPSRPSFRPLVLFVYRTDKNGYKKSVGTICLTPDGRRGKLYLNMFSEEYSVEEKERRDD